MHFNLKNLKKNIIASWTFSYVVIICIMLIVITLIGAIYTAATKKISDEFNNYIFETVTDDVNNTLLSMNNLYLRINENENLKSMLYAGGNLEGLNSTYTLIDNLRSYCQFAEKTNEVFVYIKSKDMIIFSGGMTPSLTYYKTYISPDGSSYEEWKKLLLDCSRLYYNSMQFTTNTNRKIDALSLIFPISQSQNDCVGVILSDKMNFLNGLEEINWEKLCDVYIYNKDGKLIAYNSNINKNNLPDNLTKLSEFKINNSVVHTSEIVVNGHIWSIATVASYETANRNLFLIQIAILFILALSLLILFFIIKNILQKNYRPIKTMLSFFNLDTEKNSITYEKLMDSISNTLKENRKMTKKLDSQTKAFEKLNVAKLLRGEIFYSSLENQGYSFHGNYFAVLTFYLEDINSLFSEDTKMKSYDKQQHLTFIIDNVITELLAQKNAQVYTTEIDGQVSCIICLSEFINANEINALAYQGLDFINRSFSLELTYALSTICEGAFNIPDAYRQTTEVLEYKRILGITEPMQYIEKNRYGESGYIFDLSKEQSIVNAIKAGNSQAALSVLSQVFGELSSQNNLPLDHIICIVLDLATTITKSAHEVTPSGVNFNDNITFYRKLKDGENLLNLYSHLSEYTIKVCEVVKSEISEGKNRMHFLLSHIEKYISDNYTSPDLNVNTIGLHFNMNSQYVSAIFKKETGKSLLDYINGLRIERAMELIKEGKYSKKEIYKMVGFTTERTFYRVLKKYEESTLEANE